LGKVGHPCATGVEVEVEAEFGEGEGAGGIAFRVRGFRTFFPSPVPTTVLVALVALDEFRRARIIPFTIPNTLFTLSRCPCWKNSTIRLSMELFELISLLLFLLLVEISHP
jgi:hypothetical protein